MSAILRNLNLAYISAPKCACTSVKELIFKLENDCNFNRIRDNKNAIRLYINGKRHYIHHFYPTISYQDQPQQILEQLQCFCVVRNPLDRIISCHKNRVIQYKELRSEQITNLEIDAPSDPDLNTFIQYLDEYQKSPQIRHHSLPLTYFLGKNPEAYTRIFNLSNINQLPGHLKKYFGRSKLINHLQKSSSEFNQKTTDLLSAQSIELIKSRYNNDFRCFGRYF